MLLLSGSSSWWLRVFGGGGGAAIAKIPSSSYPYRTMTATTRRSAMMEIEEEEEEEEEDSNSSRKVDQLYNLNRWSARESFQFMYGGRPWKTVVDFYSHLIINGDDPLSLLFPHHQKPKQQDGFQESTTTKAGGRWERLTFMILLSYHGASFDGWQKQPGLNTVQGLVEKSLGRFVDDRKAKQLTENSLPLQGCASVAGRTDKGVTALQQVCSFYTWRKGVTCQDIKDAVNNVSPEKIRALSVSKVSRVFHPNFAAKWRRYLYIFPLDDEHQAQSESSIMNNIDEIDDQMKGQSENNEVERFSVVYNDNEDLICEVKPKDFDVSKVNELLLQLEGKTLSYKMFARDTKASRSIGPPTECLMFHARAAETKLPCINQGCKEVRVMCVELVANRFLRKMVRVLVATAIREAAAGADNDALLKLIDASCRRATAPPAPPDGLCLVDVGYGVFRREICFIQ